MGMSFPAVGMRRGGGGGGEGVGREGRTSRASSRGLRCSGRGKPKEERKEESEERLPWWRTVPHERRRKESNEERSCDEGWWMERTMAGRRLVAAARRRELTTRRAEALSRPEVGSSRMRTEGLRRRLRPSDTRRSSPPEREPGRREWETWESRRLFRRDEAASAAEVGGSRRRAERWKVSETVRNGRGWSCWGRWAESRRKEVGCRGEELRRSWPEVGAVRAARMSRRVDFPAPLGPTTARSSPERTVRETSRRMWVGGGGNGWSRRRKAAGGLE
ncbi:hypothetical protein IEQ34_018117 [Dendrobium chrysotoxum]|uniref:Uncharacterized protein n=1 Tax=Dendrobium chrysotoxum TaxID=161865 RepID=A0AAV7GDH6_DENCH|nr:hypothetical protein IEQ34_018117 [Dendrobium chrysotoxum]